MEDNELESAAQWTKEAEKSVEIGLYDQAHTILDEVISHYPDYPRAYGKKGSLCLKQGCYKEAMEFCLKAIEVSRGYLPAYFSLGEVYGEIDESELQIECYKAIIGMDPQNIPAYARLGEAYGANGEYDKEIECYQAAIKIEPKNVALKKKFILVLEEKRDREWKDASKTNWVQALGLVADVSPANETEIGRILKALEGDKNEVFRPPSRGK